MLLASVSYARWTPPVRISDEGYSLGPRIAANGETLHVVYWANPTGTNRVFYLRSSDGGGAWNQAFVLPDITVMFNCVSPLVRIEGNSIVSVWRGNIIGGGGDMNFGFRLSADGGRYWNDVNYLIANNQESLQKHAFSVSNSHVFLVYSRIEEGDLIIEFTKSSDWGEIWTVPTEIFRTQETGRFDMVAREDTIHFLWIGRFNYDDEWETYYIKSEDAGETWSDNVALSTLDDRGSLWPSISVNDDGDLVACWMDFKYSPYFLTGDIFVRYSQDAGDTWIEDDQLTSHHRAHATRILWQGDSIHVVWEDWRDDQTDIYYMRSIDNGLTWEDEQQVEEDPGQSLNPDLSVVNEIVHVVWRQDSGLDGRGLYYSRWEDEVSQIPTLSEWGMFIFALLLLAAGTMAVIGRKRATLTIERR